MNKRKKITRNRYRNSLDEHGFHSWSYRKHFEGYEERKQGKKLIREYKGSYYCRKVNRFQNVMLKMIYFILYLAAVVMFLAAGTAVDTIGNSKWYRYFGEAVDLLLLIYLLKIIIFYLTAPIKLTIGEYKEDSRLLIITAFGSAGCLLLTAFAYLFENVGSSQPMALQCFCEMSVGAICLAAIGIIEKKIKYEIKNANQILLKGDQQNGV